jgi:hypothetical protein
MISISGTLTETEFTRNVHAARAMASMCLIIGEIKCRLCLIRICRKFFVYYNAVQACSTWWTQSRPASTGQGYKKMKTPKRRSHNNTEFHSCGDIIMYPSNKVQIKL